jgi:gas vesicle protein
MTTADFLPNRDEIAKAIGLRTTTRMSDFLWPGVQIFAAGVLVGAGLALLFAPRTGATLRAEIGEKASELAKRAGDLGGRASDRVRETAGQAASRAQERLS